MADFHEISDGVILQVDNSMAQTISINYNAEATDGIILSQSIDIKITCYKEVHPVSAVTNIESFGCKEKSQLREYFSLYFPQTECQSTDPNTVPYDIEIFDDALAPLGGDDDADFSFDSAT